MKIEIQNSVLRSRLSYKVLLYASFDYTQQAQPKDMFITFNFEFLAFMKGVLHFRGKNNS